MAYVKKRLELDNVGLRKRNFRGEITDMNQKGKRQCLVTLNSDNAEALGFDSIADMVNVLKADGWVIRRFNVTDENDDPDAYMPVEAVFYDDNQSMIYLKTPNRRGVLLNKDTVKKVDSADIEKVDIIIEQHYYNYLGREGYNNRVKSMEITINEDKISARNMADDYEEDELPFANPVR